MTRLWPVAVVGLIGTALVANLLLLYLATSDPGFAVEPDYYAKALAWDERRDQERSNIDLGWALDLTVDPLPAADGSQHVVVRLRDAAEAGIDGAALTLSAFHNARSADVQQVELGEVQAGEYGARLRFRRPGLWEFRVEARRGDALFTRRWLQDVAVRRPPTRGRP